MRKKILNYILDLFDKFIDKLLDESTFISYLEEVTRNLCEIDTHDRESSLYGCVPRVKIYTEDTCFTNGYKEPTVEITMTTLNKQTYCGVVSKTSFPIMKVYENSAVEEYYNNVLKPCLETLENDMKEKLGD